ncbi:hypothetical protein W02_06650 [Nitrospira sp. KM1]|uniref:YicC/YloC family endoribonuclease n=1 Tax=Nitrospira sp. KM1 TaxID=1936990 RepID=UPI0013A70ED1|nr:YicC/YloC family endoribonuclease [Nitrospira sp. KM1]BCA53525.1 hypothetical protein W02_06650 [Nitrospira sp. KM1]
MIKSMTGFGRKQAAHDDGAVLVEVRSVNHRFLEVACRLPRAVGRSEDTVKKLVQQYCVRGRVDVSVSAQGGKAKSGTVNVDLSLAKQYHRNLRDLKKSLKLSGAIDIHLLAGFRDVISITDQQVEDPDLTTLVHTLVGQALAELDAMRRQEGAALAKDMLGRIGSIRTHATAVTERVPQAVQETFDRMKARVGKLMDGEMPDSMRLHQELAVYADRGDITEELVRLESHMVQFEQHLNRAESVGKTLDFLLQEMGREVNTVGSKANDAVIAGHVVQMKAELERIREQVQNVE